MTDEKRLTIVERKQVAFYEDELLAVRTAAGEIMIPVRPICDVLGVDWSAQRRRIERDPVLSEESRLIDVKVDDTYRSVTRGVLCLPLDYISGFLFGITASRVKLPLRERLIRYQRECYKVLAEAFQEGRLTADPSLDDLLKSDSPAAQAYQMAQAIMKMARQQLLIESRLDEHDAQLAVQQVQLEDTRTILGEQQKRLEQVEEELGDPGRHITPDQAMQISQAVKAVAMALGKRTKRNEYGGVYGEMYRRYQITGYKMLPKSKFEDAMNWLNEWLQSLTGDSPF